VTRIRKHQAEIESQGFKVIPIEIMRSGKNPLQDLKVINRLIHIFRSEHPDIVHLVAMKPVLYGSLAAWLTGIPYVVTALAGMGHVFSSEQLVARLLRPIIRILFRLLLNRKNTRTILQNPDDQKMFVDTGILDPSRIRLIRGSGVDINTFVPTPEPDGTLTVILASRMLRDKGIVEFYDAARLLQERKVKAKFALVGDPDPVNPTSISKQTLEAWQREGVLEWWGHRDNMPEVFARSHIVCLPSFYGEGVPKVLIEAAACGQPIITTDTPGCREIVRNGENGILVPVKDYLALADAIQRLIENPELRKRMGLRGREIAVNEFSIEKVVQETLAVYMELMV
jgi:glycosyltransferase involved in cell wall biosynthesis